MNQSFGRIILLYGPGQQPRYGGEAREGRGRGIKASVCRVRTLARGRGRASYFMQDIKFIVRLF